MKTKSLIAIVITHALAVGACAQSLATRRHIETATKETIPAAVNTIAEKTGAKIDIELDAASFGEDEKVWVSFYLVCNRLTGALEEVAKDQLGKDALAKNVKKVVLTKLPAGGKDEVVLKEGTLTVKTVADDNAISMLQGVIQTYLEKAL